MEAHSCQIEEKTNISVFYLFIYLFFCFSLLLLAAVCQSIDLASRNNELFPQNIVSLCRNNGVVSRNNDLLCQNNDVVSRNIDICRNNDYFLQLLNYCVKIKTVKIMTGISYSLFLIPN